MNHYSWLSLLPPFIVIGMVLLTHQLNIALVCGIITAAMIVADGQLLSALTLCAQKVMIHFSDIDNIYLYLLLIAISSLITLLTVTGSAVGCARIIGKKMKTKKGVEISTIALSTLLSLDDYLSILTVGFVMRPIADRLAVARTKLAYIVHALAGPLVIIVPISTWAAAILAQLDNAGLYTDSFYVYLKTIPFIFYSLFVFLSVCFVVSKRISFGSLGRSEKSGTIATIHDKNNDRNNEDASVTHSLVELFMPIGLLLVSIVMGILYAGGYFLFGGQYSFVEAFRNNDKTFLIFLIASLLSCMSSFLLFMYKRMIRFADIPMVMYEGFMLIRSSIVMIVLASILGSFLRIDLHTGSYIAHMLLGSMPLFLIPVFSFIVSLLITLVTGSAWGTFSLLIPITIQMLVGLLSDTTLALDNIAMLYPMLGAVLSGAACGNHISPFAETTVMTATSTGIDPIEHARTQWAYAVPVIIAAAMAFLVAGITCDSFGLLLSCCTSLLVGMFMMFSLLLLGNICIK